MKRETNSTVGQKATGNTNAEQHLISNGMFRCLNTLKLFKVDTVRQALHDMFIEFNSHTLADREIKDEVTQVYISLLQLCDALQETKISEATPTFQHYGSEKRIMKAVYELFEWSDAKCYAEGLNVAESIMRDSVGKDGGVFPKVAENASFDINRIKEFLYQIEILKLEDTLDKAAAPETIIRVENEIIGTAV